METSSRTGKADVSDQKDHPKEINPMWNTQDRHLQELDNSFLHRLPGQHIYRGCLYNEWIDLETLTQIGQLEFANTDCIVAGYPKSGTSWLEEIVYLILNDGDISKCNTMPNYLRVPLIEDRRTHQMAVAQPGPRIFKTHLPVQSLPGSLWENKTKVVLIVRNPKDTAVSFYHFYKSLLELGPFLSDWHEFLRMFSSGYTINGDWFSYTLNWWRKRQSSNIFLITYEEMKHNPAGAISDISNFLEKQLRPDVLQSIREYTSFESMKNNPMTNFSTASTIDQSISPFMRKGQVGDWKNYFTVTQNEEFDLLIHKKMSQDKICWRYE